MSETATATDVSALIDQLADQLRKTLDRRIAVDVECDPCCPPCSAERAELLLMLLELVTNARDAMPDGGTLRLRASAAAGGVEISVSDTGAGMAAAVRDQAVRPGFTTKNRPRGGGLGLSRVVQFARECGGELSLRSAPGEGTLVTLRLPAA